MLFLFFIRLKIYRTVILPFVLYECEAWSLTLSEAHGLNVQENTVLRKTFGTKREKVTGDWKRF
jgi:hypothetical protein